MLKDPKHSNNIITHPAHYIEGRAFEPITVIEEFGLCHHLACVVKYIARAGRKTSLLNDLKKAEWYLDRGLQCCSAGVNSCLIPLGVRPLFSIQEILEDWNLTANLDTALSYILAARLGTLKKDFCNNKTLGYYTSSLQKSLKHLRLAISECEQGERQ